MGISTTKQIILPFTSFPMLTVQKSSVINCYWVILLQQILTDVNFNTDILKESHKIKYHW